MSATPVTRNDELSARAASRFASGTTDAADAVLRVPLAYYRDTALHDRDRHVLATTPLALAASCEIAAPHDYLVLPGVGDAIRHAQHDHVLIGRNEVGVQHLVRTLAGAAEFAL